jgi:hypothetical protein
MTEPQAHDPERITSPIASSGSLVMPDNSEEVRIAAPNANNGVELRMPSPSALKRERKGGEGNELPN